MKVEEEIVTILKLNEEERQWLHSVMQNPLWNQSPSEEYVVDRYYRKNFFDATGEKQ